MVPTSWRLESIYLSIYYEAADISVELPEPYPSPRILVPVQHTGELEPIKPFF